MDYYNSVYLHSKYSGSDWLEAVGLQNLKKFASANAMEFGPSHFWAVN
jgi:hypothetical protein